MPTFNSFQIPLTTHLSSWREISWSWREIEAFPSVHSSDPQAANVILCLATCFYLRLKCLFYCRCHACPIASHDSEDCMGIHNPSLTSRRMGPSAVLIGDMLCGEWRHASAKMLPIFLDTVQHKTIGHLFSRAFHGHGNLQTFSYFFS